MMTAFLQIEKTVFDDTLKDANSIDYGKYLNKNNKENKNEN